MLNSRLGLVCATNFCYTSTGSQRLVILIPKLRMQFAEFLNEGFLAHLRILFLPTCVGFSTGICFLVRSFSRQRGSCDFDFSGEKSPHRFSVLKTGDLPPVKPTALDVHNQSHAHISFCVTPSSNGNIWYRNFSRLSIAYASSPPLRPRLTPGRRALPGKP